MAKSNLNRGAFGRARSPEPAEQETNFMRADFEDAISAPSLPVSEIKLVRALDDSSDTNSTVVTSPARVPLDDRRDLLNKIEILEERVKTLENKLQTLVAILTKEMSGGLRGGPESLGRLLKSTEILKT